MRRREWIGDATCETSRPKFTVTPRLTRAVPVRGAVRSLHSVNYAFAAEKLTTYLAGCSTDIGRLSRAKILLPVIVSVPLAADTESTSHPAMP